MVLRGDEPQPKPSWCRALASKTCRDNRRIGFLVLASFLFVTVGIALLVYRAYLGPLPPDSVPVNCAVLGFTSWLGRCDSNIGWIDCQIGNWTLSFDYWNRTNVLTNFWIPMRDLPYVPGQQTVQLWVDPNDQSQIPDIGAFTPASRAAQQTYAVNFEVGGYELLGIGLLACLCFVVFGWKYVRADFAQQQKKYDKYVRSVSWQTSFLLGLWRGRRVGHNTSPLYTHFATSPLFDQHTTALILNFVDGKSRRVARNRRAQPWAHPRVKLTKPTKSVVDLEIATVTFHTDTAAPALATGFPAVIHISS